jgi:hypothetical protein
MSGHIYFTENWRDETLQPGSESDKNVKLQPKSGIFESISWLESFFFLGEVWGLLLKEGVKTYLLEAMSSLLCLRIYSRPHLSSSYGVQVYYEEFEIRFGLVENIQEVNKYIALCSSPTKNSAEKKVPEDPWLPTH